MERAAALRDLKLRVGSGVLDLDFTKGMDSLDKHVEHISFSAVRHILRTWAAEPRFQPTVAKSSISTIGLQQSHVTTESTINILNYPVVQVLDTITVLDVTNLGDHNSVTTPSASLHETGFFL